MRTLMTAVLMVVMASVVVAGELTKYTCKTCKDTGSVKCAVIDGKDYIVPCTTCRVPKVEAAIKLITDLKKKVETDPSAQKDLDMVKAELERQQAVIRTINKVSMAATSVMLHPDEKGRREKLTKAEAELKALLDAEKNGTSGGTSTGTTPTHPTQAPPDPTIKKVLKIEVIEEPKPKTEDGQ